MTMPHWCGYFSLFLYFIGGPVNSPSDLSQSDSSSSGSIRSCSAMSLGFLVNSSISAWRRMGRSAVSLSPRIVLWSCVRASR